MGTTYPLIAERFQIQDLVGQGSMSDVYRGLDLANQTPVAIKVLKRDVAAKHPILIERFAHEGEALRRLNHPNIARVYATLEEGNYSYIVMEYIGGGTLRDWMERQPRMPIELVLKIGLELADALARAHHLNIIHRDIKPSNIMMAEDGSARLADFGIARLGDGTPITQTGIVLGTYAYLSPEACYGSPMDARSDLWSFGVLLFEMLAGQRPFEADSIGALVTAVLHKPIPDLRVLRPDTPDALLALVYQLLEKDPTHRIASARLLGVQLERIQQTRFPGNEQSARDELATPMPSMGLPPLVPNNLPQRATAFLGRERELRQIHDMLADPACRLITLTGPGGIGKTRLAIQAAHENLTRFPDGVCYVPLEHLNSRGHIILALADALNFRFYEDKDPRQQIYDYLREKNLLLVFDNFEHILDGAELVAEILSRAPQIKVLATSRERLNLQSEWLLEVDGMDVPSDTDTAIEGYSAVSLFVQHARRVDPNFTLTEADRDSIVRICRLTEGMPLSIELAASWVRSLSTADLADEIGKNIDFLVTSLRDVPERHRSLRAIFEYSWNLLSPAERNTFMRLSLFQGPFRRDAARAITGASPIALSALVDKSLMRARSDSFELLPILARYAAEKLNEDQAALAEVRARFCSYYADFLAKRRDALAGADQKRALDEIALEIENIRTAWYWSCELGRIEDIENALETMFMFHETQSAFTVGQELFVRAVGAARLVDALTVQGRLMARQAVFAILLGQMDDAISLLEEARAYAEERGDQQEMAFCFNRQGRIAYLQGQYVEASIFFEASCQRSAKAGDRHELAVGLTHIGLIAYHQGRYPDALRNHQEALDIYRTLGDRRGTSNSMRHLGTVYLSMADYPQARALFEQSLAINREMRDRMGASLNLNNLGMIAFEQGSVAEAQAFHEESLALKREIGNWRGVAFSLNNLGLVAFHQADYQRARKLLEEGLAKSRDLGEERAIANILSNLGDVAHAMSDFVEARRLYQESVALKEALGDRAGIAHSQHKAGLVAFDQGVYSESIQRFEHSLELYRELGHQRGVAECLADLGFLYLSIDQHDNARRMLSEALQIAQQIEARPVVMLAMVGVAFLAHHIEDYACVIEMLAMPLSEPASPSRAKERAAALLARVEGLLSAEDLSILRALGEDRSLGEAGQAAQDVL